MASQGRTWKAASGKNLAVSRLPPRDSLSRNAGIASSSRILARSQTCRVRTHHCTVSIEKSMCVICHSQFCKLVEPACRQSSAARLGARRARSAIIASDSSDENSSRESGEAGWGDLKRARKPEKRRRAPAQRAPITGEV